MFLLQPILDFLHFLRTTVFYIWSFSLHLGRGTFMLLKNIAGIVQDIYKALIIVGEELLRFFTELNTSIDTAATYISNSANTGISGFVDAIVVFFQGFSSIFTKSEIHTRLLATRLGLIVKNLFNLLYGALTLIADTVWWLITLIPRAIIKLTVATADFCIFTSTNIGKAILYATQTLFNDIFRITISLFVIFLIWKKRHHLHHIFQQCCTRARSIVNRRLQLMLARWRNPNRLRFGNLARPPMRRSPLANTGQQSLNESKLPYQQTCVVCRDNPRSVLLWPCRHMCLCELCADTIAEMSQQTTICPLCRSQVEFALSIYT